MVTCSAEPLRRRAGCGPKARSGRSSCTLVNCSEMIGRIAFESLQSQRNQSVLTSASASVGSLFSWSWASGFSSVPLANPAGV